MKHTDTDTRLESLGFKLVVFKQSDHIVEYINELSGMEIRYNLLSKTVRLKKHLLGQDEAFESNQILLDLISVKMLELTKGR
jgi:archaellum component FlaD/FlaE